MSRIEQLRDTIQGCRERKRESQKKLYKNYYAYGMSITLRYAETRDQAAAILNDAFMDVFSNIESYDTERPFKPWLRRIILNKAINHYHKHKNDADMQDLDSAPGQLSEEQSILSGISYKEIVEMVQELTPAYRTVFNLFVIEGFKHSEIASMLDISEGTSKSNLAKAKRNLRSILEKNLI